MLLRIDAITVINETNLGVTSRSQLQRVPTLVYVYLVDMEYDKPVRQRLHRLKRVLTQLKEHLDDGEVSHLNLDILRTDNLDLTLSPMRARQKLDDGIDARSQRLPPPRALSIPEKVVHLLGDRETSISGLTKNSQRVVDADTSRVHPSLLADKGCAS